MAPPPRPPPNKPPPPPLRSVSNQNLPQMPLSTPTTNTLNSAASANNVSVLKEQLKDRIGNGSAISGGGSTPNVEKVSSSNGSVPPPLPPHRTCPAPPPPNASRQASNVRFYQGVFISRAAINSLCYFVGFHVEFLCPTGAAAKALVHQKCFAGG